MMSTMQRILSGFIFLLLFAFNIAAAANKLPVWTAIAERSIKPNGSERWIVPQHYQTYRLNTAGLKEVLNQAPPEFGPETCSELSLPFPDLQLKKFCIKESPIMEPELAHRYPEIRTYMGKGIDDASETVRLDWTLHGFHAMVLSSKGTILIDPYRRKDTTHYMSYYKRDLGGSKEFQCHFQNSGPRTVLPILRTTAAPVMLRTFRLAVGATGEFTQFHGGTVPDGLSAVITIVNRVNGIYERDFAARVILVANEDQVIFVTPNSDPYTDGNAGAMLSQNQTTLDNIIGPANYDVGHAFGAAGGGGVAGLGVVCSGSKAFGVTSLSPPEGDVYSVDYVSHEMGHQFDGNHSFNGTTNNCGGNRNGSTAYEPGSGSTIMAYAGICGAEDLQPNSDDYFHVISYDEMFSFIQSASCGVSTSTANTTPSANAGPNYTIPRSTPFVLTGDASDTEGDSLTYCWEQFNLGAASPPNTDNGTRPIFRSFDPVSTPERIFPKLSDILNNTTTIGESLPTTNRTLTFRLSVRDNNPAGGGQGIDLTQIAVTSGAGPFLVTQPNAAVTWMSGTQQEITWDVAGTSVAPVNAATVDILLSTDGGNTFGTVLETNTPNDGSHLIIVPPVSTNNARAKIAASNNIFFDISNTDFTIMNGGCPPISVNPAALPNSVIGDAYNQTLDASGAAPPYTFAVTAGALPSGLTLSAAGAISGVPDTEGDFSFTVTATDSLGCTGARNYSISIISSCLFCDDFEDGQIDPNWNYIKGSWIESDGILSGTPTGRKTTAIASPAFAGCTDCSIEAQIQTGGGAYNRVWLLAWYQSKSDTMELLMKEESDRWILKQRSGGRVVAKAKAARTIDPNINYIARITYNGSEFEVTIDGVSIITMPAAAMNGTVGFQSKGTTGRFGYIAVD